MHHHKLSIVIIVSLVLASSPLYTMRPYKLLQPHLKEILRAYNPLDLLYSWVEQPKKIECLKYALMNETASNQDKKYAEMLLQISAYYFNNIKADANLSKKYVGTAKKDLLSVDEDAVSNKIHADNLKNNIVDYVSSGYMGLLSDDFLLRKIRNALVVVKTLSYYKPCDKKFQQLVGYLNPKLHLSSLFINRESLMLDVVRNNQWELIQVCLDYGMDLNIKQGLDWTLLHMAVLEGNINIAQRLLHQGADPNVPNLTGDLALHYATWECDEQLVETLLKYGSSVNVQNVFMQTPLVNALSNLHPSLNSLDKKHKEAKIKTVVMLLLSYGANVTIQNQEKETAYDIALAEGYTTIAPLVKANHYKIA